MTHNPQPTDTDWRRRALHAEGLLAQSYELIAELHEQLFRANAAAVRMAQRPAHARRRAA